MLSSCPRPHPDAAVLDAQRLAALNESELLDSPPEASFDRITALTAQVTAAPVSLVALIGGDRAYLKSAHGLSEMPRDRSLPLSHALCHHVVRSGQPLAIGDAHEHPLGQGNAGVAALGIRAYLGVPVRSATGHVLGSLCAIDRVPREWTDGERVSLTSLAAAVESEISLRSQLRSTSDAEVLARAETKALTALLSINAKLAAELDPDRLVQAVVDAGLEVTGSTMGAFYYRPDGANARAVLFAASGVPDEAMDVFAVFHKNPDTLGAFSESVRVADIRTHPEFAWLHKLIGGRMDLASLIGIPVRDASGVSMGTLLFGHPEPGRYGPREYHGAHAIADQAAIGLQNARLHRALDGSEKRLRRVLGSLSDVVFQTNANGLFTYLNAAWDELTGYPASQALGESFLRYAAGDLDALAQRFAESVAVATPEAPNATTLDVMIRCADGSLRHVEVRAQALFGRRRTLTGCSGTITDITDRVRYASEREAREEAERMARLQSALLANMSHEIRTPLTAILGNAEILADEVPHGFADLAGSIHRGGQRLMKTLNSVLDLAQIDAGTMEPQPQRVPLQAFLRESLHSAMEIGRAKGITVSIDVPAGVPDVSLDPGLLDRAVANLAGNAVKFTERGSVSVSARHASGVLSIVVEDTGIGIAPEVLPHLFDPFRQGSEGYGRTHEGNGLGLAIVVKVVRLLGGEVDVESATGTGARFTLTIPAQACEDVPQATTPRDQAPLAWQPLA